MSEVPAKLPKDDEGNVLVDFVWGNLPMQPDENREEPLDPELDDHDIAKENYAGYPEFKTVIVPNISGLAEEDIAAKLADDLVVGEKLPDSVDGEKVIFQVPWAGSSVSPGETVDYRLGKIQ